MAALKITQDIAQRVLQLWRWASPEAAFCAGECHPSRLSGDWRYRTANRSGFML